MHTTNCTTQSGLKTGSWYVTPPLSIAYYYVHTYNTNKPYPCITFPPHGYSFASHLCGANENNAVN